MDAPGPMEGPPASSARPAEGRSAEQGLRSAAIAESGQIMKAAELLANSPMPTRDQIVAHMVGNICRCGTYLRIVRAIQSAAKDT